MKDAPLYRRREGGGSQRGGSPPAVSPGRQVWRDGRIVRPFPGNLTMRIGITCLAPWGVWQGVRIFYSEQFIEDGTFRDAEKALPNSLNDPLGDEAPRTISIHKCKGCPTSGQTFSIARPAGLRV